ncbi:MAG: 4Fe-4S binding protein [Treponema sp.]|nr:4Fe-4S binding protein [Treponema sp.]
MQFFLSGVKSGISLYITGFLMIIGVTLGRFICGYACPMGLLQDILYRIKTPKLLVRLRFLRYVKYLVLAVFVIILPLAAADDLIGLGQPWFCKYICPSGTIFGAAPLLAANDFLRKLIGAQFILKTAVAAVIAAAAVFLYRVFCRVLCPLGAIYALFNKISILHIRCDRKKCLSCGKCSKECQILITPVTQPDALECVRCGKCVNICQTKALSYSMRGTVKSLPTVVR